MKYLMILLVGVCLLVAPVLAEQQTTPPKPGPQHRLHGFLEGDNSCEFKDGGEYSMKCEWLHNGLFMLCNGQYTPPTGSTVVFHTVQGYNQNENVHTMYRFRSDGQIDHAKGWFKDNKITWWYDDELVNDKWQRQNLTVELNSTKVSWTFKWERSVEGEPWQVTQEGKCTKVKSTTN